MTIPFTYIAIVSLAVFLLPSVTFVVLFFFGKKLPRKGDWFASFIMGICFLLSVYIFSQTWKGQEHYTQIPWFKIPGSIGVIDFSSSILINNVSAMMMVVVTLISFLVHLYSIEYMYDKMNYTRYFPYLGLFTSSMIGIVISNNLMVTFMCWELVGFASYLLIGFWFEKSAASRAAKKAFLINRIGDLGFMIGLFIVYAKFGTFDLLIINKNLSGTGVHTELLFTVMGLGIFCGCVGKSAQFPLQLWLPDAMEGPTPASALIHAATMVAAGVFLLYKSYILFTPDTLLVITCVGCATAFMGALPAMVQTDIKKVLAFSTISQLGYMVMAIGVKAYDAALFHLLTHAFFKACLFLTAGAVIHEMHHVKRAMFLRGYFNSFDTLDMRLMGGLRKKMPVTFITYFISSMALVGVPLFSGFLSKDAILEGVFNWAIIHGGGLYYVIPLLALLTVTITAFYMIRQMLMVFFGDFKLIKIHPASAYGFEKIHDPGILMKIPMLVLAILSIFIFYTWNPLNVHQSWFMDGVSELSQKFHEISPVFIMLLSVSAVIIGTAVAYLVYNPRRNGQPDLTVSQFASVNFIKNNWYLDTVYMNLLVKPGMRVAGLASKTDSKIIDGIIHIIAISFVVFSHIIAFIDKYVVDGLVNIVARLSASLGKFTKSFQQGRVQGYFSVTIISFVLLILLLFFILN